MNLIYISSQFSLYFYLVNRQYLYVCLPMFTYRSSRVFVMFSTLCFYLVNRQYLYVCSPMFTYRRSRVYRLSARCRHLLMAKKTLSSGPTTLALSCSLSQTQIRTNATTNRDGAGSLQFNNRWFIGCLKLAISQWLSNWQDLLDRYCKQTLPKAQRTRGLSSSCQSNFLRSYHKFKHKS